MATQIYKIRSKIWVAPSPRNLAARNIKISARFRTTSRLDRNNSGTQQDVVNRKTALQTTDTSAHCTGKLNLVYFGPQTAKIGQFLSTHRP